MRPTVLTYLIFLFFILTTACSDWSDELLCSDELQRYPIGLSAHIDQRNLTRADEQGFVTGDRMGIYIVDRENGEAGTLGASDNRASNLLYTFNGDTYTWSAPTSIYWRDQQTPIDIYGYYPGANYINDPNAYTFSVQRDQSTEAANGELGGYEQSDLLWGKAENISYTEKCITITYGHILAGVRVQLKKGDGITNTEWEKLEKIVLIDNTVTKASVNLSHGKVETFGTNATPIRMAPQSEDQYRAVVIPQTVSAGKQLLSITLDGRSYSHRLESTMTYQSGKLHNFAMTVSKSQQTGDYELSVAFNGISPWENDETSHQFSALAYVIAHCEDAGTLRESITAAGYEYRTVQNLKVTGTLTTEDFTLLRDSMPALKHLNLKDAEIKNIYHSYWTSDYNGSLVEYYLDNELPPGAFYGNKTIRSLILPTTLTRIGGGALRETQLMYSTLEVPEGVTYIGDNAFSYLEDNGVELILPSTLDSICASAFHHCHFACELQLSDNITYIGDDAFTYTPNFYGTFHVPSKLKSVDGAFGALGSNGSFNGEIEIPQGITSVCGAFGIALSKRVALTLPAGVKTIGRGWPDKGFASIIFNDDLEEIGDECFAWYNMPPDGIMLPSHLQKIGYRAFLENGLEGELIIPENCLIIGGGAFKDNQLTKVQLPSRLEIINGETFRNSRQLTKITIPKHVSYIGEYAFAGCIALQTIVCLNPEPPVLGSNAFADNFMDKLILEVPEQSVELYRHTDGWKEFQNITAYHELAFNVSEIVCLDKGTTRTGILSAEGSWKVSECPSWVTVSPSSGSGKEELTITVSSTTESREGQIVFRLTDQDYTTYTDVQQVYSDDYREDATVTLQTATVGGIAVPLFMVGEGYGAEDIVSGQYLSDMQEQMEHLFSIEPYKTYRNYFTVTTAYACSPESGIGGLTRFRPDNARERANDLVWQYAQEYGTGIRAGTAILVLCNTPVYGNHTDLWDDGTSFSWIGLTPDSYPYDQCGDVLHYLGGRGFGKLGPEYVNHFTFMKTCTCPGCNMTAEYNTMRQRGWWQNVSISSKMTDLPWQPFIFHETYASYVDVYEGALNHSRSTYRSESQSVMGAAHIYYYNTISRYEIVKRIMAAVGKTISFDEFTQNDKIEIPE